MKTAKMLERDIRRAGGVDVIRGLPLSAMTTFRIGGMADIVAKPCSVSALESVLALFERLEVPYHVLGNGSNLLVDDRGAGTVISLEGINRITFHDNVISAGGGCRLMTLSAWAMRHEIGGFEHFAGIPASTGGAAFMNAGTGKISFNSLVENIRISGPGGSIKLNMKDLACGYRDGGIPKGSIISEVWFRNVGLKETCTGTPGLYFKKRSRIVSLTRDIMRQRRGSQPLETANAGCIFRNPAERPAGMIIDRCGLKGRRVGGAEVSEKHANFIINRGDASFDDVLELIEIVKCRVRDMTGIKLENEIEIWRLAA